MTAPLIGINCDSFADAAGPITGLRPAYWEAVAAAGADPVLIPPLHDRARLDALLDHLDAVVMTGGDDISPERLALAQSAPPTVAPGDPRREAADFLLIQRLLARRTPVLAICLACQQLNVARGGTLYLDLPHDGPRGEVIHARKFGITPLHAVTIAADSLLAATWENATAAAVNSAHHQAIREPGRGLRPVAHAADGVVEAVEVEGHPFFLAVQWHPERMRGDRLQEKLFEALIAHAVTSGPSAP